MNTNDPQKIEPGYIKRWIPQVLSLIWRAPISFASVFLLGFLIAQSNNFFVMGLCAFMLSHLIMELFAASDLTKVNPSIYIQALKNAVKVWFFAFKSEPFVHLIVIGIYFWMSTIINPSMLAQRNMGQNFAMIFYLAALFLTKTSLYQYLYPLHLSTLHADVPINNLKSLCKKAQNMNKSYCLFMEGLLVIMVLFFIIFVGFHFKFSSYLISILFVIIIGMKYMAYREIFFGKTKNSNPQESKSAQLSLNINQP